MSDNAFERHTFTAPADSGVPSHEEVRRELGKPLPPTGDDEPKSHPDELPHPDDHEKVRERLQEAITRSPIAYSVWDMVRNVRESRGNEPFSAASRVRALELMVIALAERNRDLQKELEDVMARIPSEHKIASPDE